jgi:hypothetical protein
MSLIYSMLMSVDGYVEDEHGRLGFAQPDEEVHAYNQAGGPSFHAPFFFPALMLRVPRPCVLRKGGYNAADRIGSNGSVESIEPKRFTVGSPVSALPNLREGRGTHNCGSFGYSKSGSPAKNSVRQVGLINAHSKIR